MKIKYFLSGRFFADLTHFRRFVDIWPNDYPFPEIVSDIKEIKSNDIVFTFGYLGCSVDLILKHDPGKVFIFDNSIFKSYGQKTFRLLNGDLKTLIKKKKNNNTNLFDFYKSQITKLIDSIQTNNNDISEKNIEADLPKYKFDLQLPWSVPLKNIIRTKDGCHIDFFEEKKLIFIKNKVINLPKQNNIDYLSSSNIPIFRGFKKSIKRKYDIDKYIFRCGKIIAPTSTLSIKGILLKKEIYISKYNPLSRFIINNPNYIEYSEEKLINLLSRYLCETSYDIRDLYEYLEY